MATFTIFATTADDALQSNDATYLTARAGGGGLGIEPSGFLATGQNFNAGTYFAWESFLSFDTSFGIGGTGSATLFIRTNNTVHSPPFIMEARLFDWGTSVTTADWVPGASLSGNTLLATRDTTGIVDNTYYSFTEVGGAFFANLNLTGETRIVIASDTLRLATVPVGDESITLFTADTAGTTSDPFLVVTTTDVSTDTRLTPVGSTVIDGWSTDLGSTTGIALAQAIDEEPTPSDTDFIQSPAGPLSTQFYETFLESASDPSSSATHTANYRYRKNVSGGNINLDVQLRQGDLPELVQSFGNNVKANGTTITATVPAGGCARGNTLVVMVAVDNDTSFGPLISVSDPQLNTYSSQGAIGTHPTAGLGIWADSFVCFLTNGLAAGEIITATLDNSVTAKAMVVMEFKNLSTSATGSFNGIDATTTPSNSVTPSTVSSVVLGLVAYEGPIEDGFTQDADTTDGSWVSITSQGTTGGTADTNMTIKGAVKIVTGTSSQTYNPTLGTARDTATLALSLTPSASPAPKIIGTWSHTNISNTFTTQNQALTTPQADSITNYGDLRFRFIPTLVTGDLVPTFVADRASANSNAAVTTVDLVLASMTVGNYLIVRTAADNSGGGGAARSITMTNQSGTPIDTGTIQQFQQNNDPGAASAGTTCNFLIAKIAATSGTVRLTYSGSVVQASVAEEWSGIHATIPIVGTPVGANSVASTNLPALTDSSIAFGNVAYALVSNEGPTADVYTADSDTVNGSWVTRTKLGTSNATADQNQTIYAAQKTVTATGSQTHNGTRNNARDSAGLIVELAAAAATVRAQVSWANLEIPTANVVKLQSKIGKKTGQAVRTGAMS